MCTFLICINLLINSVLIKFSVFVKIYFVQWIFFIQLALDSTELIGVPYWDCVLRPGDIIYLPVYICIFIYIYILHSPLGTTQNTQMNIQWNKENDMILVLHSVPRYMVVAGIWFHMMDNFYFPRLTAILLALRGIAVYIVFYLVLVGC